MAAVSRGEIRKGHGGSGGAAMNTCCTNLCQTNHTYKSTNMCWQMYAHDMFCLSRHVLRSSRCAKPVADQTQHSMNLCLRNGSPPSFATEISSTTPRRSNRHNQGEWRHRDPHGSGVPSLRLVLTERSTPLHSRHLWPVCGASGSRALVATKQLPSGVRIHGDNPRQGRRKHRRPQWALHYANGIYC